MEKNLLQENGWSGSENGLGERQNAKLVRQRVRQAILSGDIPAGAQISQVRLAEELGVSRTPFARGAAVTGARGAGGVGGKPPHPVTVLFVKDLEQLYAMRMQLETLARLTVPR